MILIQMLSADKVFLNLSRRHVFRKYIVACSNTCVTDLFTF